MSNNQSNGSNRSRFKEWWQTGKIQKTSRITYDVIWNIVLFFIIVGVVGIFFAGGLGAGYFASLVKDEPVRAEEDMKKDVYNYEENTELYFAQEKYFGKIRSDLYREEVTLDQVSKHLKNAVIATEDAYFEEHNGIVPKAIMRAIFQELTNASVKTGGSTLTQQLIKNQILTNEVSFERKAKEMLLAMRLEKFFEKDEILEAYLNVVPFGRDASGRNIAGAETAAQGIFGKSSDELNLAQAAYIAGMPQSPFLYTPFKNNGEVKSVDGITPGMKRMRTVLSRMKEAEMITSEEYDKAINYNIAADLAEPQPSPIQKYPWLTIEIEKRATKILADKLAEQDGYTEEDLKANDSLREQYKILADRSLRQEGYKIHTTIDKEIYDKMQQIAKEYKQYGPDKPQQVTDPETGEQKTIMEPVQVGGMLLENSTGKIVGFIGGRDYETENLNHATDALRPNGSTMKPLLVYAPAIELGEAQPGSVVADIEQEFDAGTDTWTPGNYTGRFHGLTSVRYALAKSFNVPAARTYADIIDQNPGSFLEKMGITSLVEEDKHILSASLGATRNGISIEENINAYATFGNMGKFVDAYMIERIESPDGEVLFEHESKTQDVFSPQTSYLTVDMMRDVLEYGTASYAQYQLNNKNVDWAGKTGTSQDWHDTWFVATNPNVTMGMWMGYDTPKPLNKCYECDLGYSNRNVKLWSKVVNAATEIRPELMAPEKEFKRPGGIVSSSYCASSGKLPSELCRQLGLVKSDIYYAKHAPTKKDDSLIQSEYVTIGETTYVAGSSTPSEFTNEGIFFNPEWIKEKGYDTLDDFSKLVPNNERWADIRVPSTEEVPNDDQAPAAPAQISASGGTLNWSPSESGDVVGYRVYRASSPGGVYELAGSSGSTSIGISGRGVYIVRAVDYFGMESGSSPSVVYGDFTPDEPEDNDNGGQDDSNSGSDSNNDNDSGSDDNSNNDSNDGSNDGSDSSNDQNNDSGGTNDGGSDNGSESGSGSDSGSQDSGGSTESGSDSSGSDNRFHV